MSRSTSRRIEAVTNRRMKQQIQQVQQIQQTRNQLLIMRMGSAFHRATVILELQREHPLKKATIWRMELRCPARKAL